MAGSPGAGRPPEGIETVIGPFTNEFKIITATSDNYHWRPDSEPAAEVVVRAHPDNTGRCWVNVWDQPSDTDGWPLNPNEWVKLTIYDLYNLRILIETSGDKVILAKSV